MTNTLHSRKQDLVRDAIHDAAVDLFVRKGFDDTTLEEISKAAGVSPRTFFRYFATRDDLMAYTVAAYGKQLVSAVEACPPRLPSLQTVHRAAIAGIEFAISQPRTRELIEIASRNPTARRAQQSGIAAIQTSLSEAFAARIRNASTDDLKPRMLARVTLMVVDLAIVLWFQGEYKDAASASKEVHKQLSGLLSENID